MLSCAVKQFICEATMPDLEVADALLPIKEKLDSIIARLEKIRGSGSTRWESLGPFQDELRAIDELYVDEKVRRG